MKKADYYINVGKVKENGAYPKVSGYVEAVADSKGNILMIGYDKRDEDGWKATELKTGFCVSQDGLDMKRKCVENVHNNIDALVKIYNLKMTDKKFYNKFIKPFENFVKANGGIKV